MRSLAARLAASRSGLYAALSYDGRMDFGPAHPHDSEVIAAFNRHQTGNKGFGLALGPAATDALARALGQQGYRVSIARSDWRLGAGDAAIDHPDLARPLLDGIATAAIEAGACDRATADWLDMRLSSLDTGRILVGHLDLLALPG
ncbi:hypothetical protein [Methylobrevis pamukkalensis]|uniref:Uncharacterized protein n=1 Tax=Methylobrevis pamukkalensis TaxID=1439726 RepID=A0A1E3H3S8_9HYPH|nr:hypothetical protein [Methylobrevis pamukkalensis]ODN70983.1 hypothetical protein A6302_01684 [Methylobrevis pamukkalensis]